MRRSANVALCLCLLQGCGETPPDYSSDDDDAEVYVDIVALLREKRDISGTIYLHPYLALAKDEEGQPRVDLSTFEYEPSAALGMLGQRDSTVVLCRVNSQGLCNENYVVMSQMARLGERDAIVIVRSLRGRSNDGALVVRLRYDRGAWKVVGAELAP